MSGKPPSLRPSSPASALPLRGPAASQKPSEHFAAQVPAITTFPTLAAPAAPPRAKPPAPPANGPVAPPARPAEERTRDWSAAGVSLVLHAALLAALAIPIMSRPAGSALFDLNLNESDGLEDSPLGEMVSLEIPAPQGAEGDHARQALEMSLMPHDLVLAAAPSSAAARGDPSNSTEDGDGDGVELRLPKNAVRAGSFAAWTTPQGVDNLWRRFKPAGEPGDMPRPGELYLIHLQIRVPVGRKTYPLSDLSGQVIGTDNYTQRLPGGLYLRGKDGDLERPPKNGRIPVKGGVVELLIVVPGAARLVKDEIQIKSRLLNETQTLTLQFQE